MVERQFDDPYLLLLAKKEMSTIRHIGSVVNEIESAVTAKVSLKDEYRMLLTTPEIGQILGLTIMLEVGDIRRFKKAGNYSSYCRCVESKRISNDKKKGANNKKTATAIWHERMSRRRIMRPEAIRRLNVSFSVRCQRATGRWPRRLWRTN